jgi:predicted metal-dependent hydrolase
VTRRPPRGPAGSAHADAQLALFDVFALVEPLQELPAAPVAPPAPARPSRSTREILLNGCYLRYQLQRARRRTIGFVAGADGLSVSAPRWVSIADIEQALREKAVWILRALADGRERARRIEAARIRWRDGAAVPFLGRSVTLVLDGSVAGAELRCAVDGAGVNERMALHLALPRDANALQIRDVVRGWLQRQARRIFEERCAVYAPRLGVRMKRLALSSAATRWGSASADGSIRLNWRLVHFGLPVIDYVVAHELAHLREMNHGAKFWAAVRSVLPEFEAARDALRDPVLPTLE